MKKLFLLCFLVIPYWVNAQCEGVDFTYNVGGDSVFTKAYQADSSIVGNYFWYHNDLFLGTGSSVLFAIAPGDVKIDLLFTTNRGDTCSVSKSFYHEGYPLVNCGLQPFTYSIEGQTVSFDFNNLQADTINNSIHWFFGEPGGGSGFYPTHTYSSPGTYTATLLFLGSDSCTVSQNITILPIQQDTSIVSDTLINCGLQPFIYSIDGQTVSFDFNNPQADTINNSIHWFFGELGGGSGFYPTHTYSSPGTYTVTLLFMGRDSCTVSQNITILPIQQDTSVVSDTLGYSVTGIVSPLPRTLLGTEISLYTYGNGTINFFKKAILTDTILFSFSNLPSGSYLVQITPASNSELFHLVEPTFYNGATNWQDAQVVNLNQDVFLSIAFVQSLQSQIPDAYWFSGNDTIVGNIQEVLPGQRALASNGFEHALVTLYNEDGEKLAAMFTNEDGRYQFAGLPAGKYTLRISYPGNAEDKEIEVEIDGDGNTQEFVPDVSLSKDLYVLSSKKKENYNLVLYPNPAKESIRLAGMSGNVKLEVLDLSGRLVDVLIGNAADDFSITNLKSGLYMIRIIQNNEVLVKSLVKE
jgi:PKD repeat protein